MTPPAHRASVASPTSPAAAGFLPALASLTVPTPVGDALLIASPEGLLALELVAGGQRASERGRTRDGGDAGGGDDRGGDDRGGDDRGGGAGGKVGADAPNDRTLRRGVFGPGGEPVFAIDAHIGDGGRARAHAGDHGAENDSANDPGAASGLDASPQLVTAGAILRDAAAQLDEYFAGALRAFTVPLDWRHVHGFAADALRAVVDVPYGETAAYGEVAIMAGRPRAARAVGTACARSPWSIIVPAHRVVRADGSIGPYGSNPETKRFLIDLERRAHA